MHARLLSLVALGACSFHGAQLGDVARDGASADADPDAALGPDDGPPLADARPADARPADARPVDGAQPTDTDGDGVPDPADNCPTVANPGQENEDGDRFGDACDPCPPVSDDSPPDGDGDGVADACDPRPTMAGDRIVLFEGFAHGSPSGWITSGTWSGTGDIVGTTTGNAWLTAQLPATAGETISAAVVVDAAAVIPAGFGVTDTHAITGDTGVQCAPYIVGPSSGLAIALDDGTQSAQTALAVQPTSALTVSLRRSGTMYTCSAGGASVSHAYTLATAPASAGLRLVGGTAHYHWVMVVAN